MTRIALLVALALPAAAAAQDLCDAYLPPSPGPVDTTVGCLTRSVPLANLTAEAPASCHNGCDSDTRQVWLPVVNRGSAAANGVVVQLFRQHAGGRTLIDEASLDIAASSRNVAGPFSLTEAEWGDALQVELQAPFVDCDPTDNTASSGAWSAPARDADRDGYASTSCGGLDCDDADADVHPGASEPAGSTRDLNCDGDLAPENPCDLDGDFAEALWCGGDDCNDNDASISPNAEEVPDDGIDNNCSGEDACPDALWVEGGSSCSSTGSAPLWGLLGLAALFYRRREV